MGTRCFIPVLGKRIRVTELDICGNLLEGAQYVVTDGFITVNLSAQVETGVEIIQRNSSGAVVVNERKSDSFKNFTVEISFVGVNPDLLSLVSNAVPYSSGEDTIGFTVPEGEMTQKFGLELWTGLSGQECAEGAEASGYLLLPFVQAGTLGDIAVSGDNAVTFSMSGAYTKGGNSWGVGVWDVLQDNLGAPGPLPTALDPMDHLLLIDTQVAPPASACDVSIYTATP